MGQVWKNEKQVPITYVEAVPNAVSILRTKRKDGYDAVQLRLRKKRREFRLDKSHPLPREVKVGEELNVSVFEENDLVRVSGVSKGKGFQGVVKRHGFGGGPKTHGQKNRFRAPGSIGNTAPQRVVPGRRMAGRMGGERVTVKHMKVVGVDAERNLILLKGAVPGARGGLLEISKVRKIS